MQKISKVFGLTILGFGACTAQAQTIAGDAFANAIAQQNMTYREFLASQQAAQPVVQPRYVVPQQVVQYPQQYQDAASQFSAGQTQMQALAQASVQAVAQITAQPLQDYKPYVPSQPIYTNRPSEVKSSVVAASTRAAQALPVGVQIENPVTTTSSTFETLEPAAGEGAGKPKDWVFKGDISFGFEKTDGNSNSLNLTTDAKASVQKDKDRFRGSLDIDKEEDDGTETEDKIIALLQYDRYLDEKLFFNLNTRYEKDEFSGIDQRISLGPGVGYDFIKSDKQNLTAQVGLDHVMEDYVNGTDDHYQSLRWEADYDLKVFEDKAKFFHFNEGLTNLSQTDDIQVRTKTGLEFDLYAGVIFKTQLNLDWDSDPAPGAESTDIKYIMSVGYKWGAE